MSPATILFIIEAAGKGVEMGVDVYLDVTAAIARHDAIDANEKLALLNRLNAAYLPERHFVKTATEPGA